MQITQRTPKFSIVLIYLIFFWIAYKAGTAIVSENPRLVYLIMGIFILMIISYIVDKIGLFPLFCILLFMYWMPLDSRLQCFSRSLVGIYPTEFGMWMLCFGILIHNSVSRSAQWNHTVSRFPFLPFLLFIAGALITCLAVQDFSSRTLVRIRLFCLLPALICLLCIYFIKTMKQAERLLWVFLVSAGLLGLVYLYGPQIDPGDMSGLGVIISGRIMRIIKLPLFGVLRMNPETTSVCFAFIIALSFNLWLNHPSFRGRLVAAGILMISGWVIVQAQGRGGLVAAGCSVVVIVALTLIFRKHSFSLFTVYKGLLKGGIVTLFLFYSIWYYASISTIKYFQLHGMTLFSDPLHAQGLDKRIWRMKESLYVFFDHPFGVGFEGFPKHLVIDGSTWFAHNLYLYLLLSIGIIGFIGFFWIFVRYIKVCWSGLYSDNLKRHILCIGGIGYTTVLFVAGVMSCIFWEVWELLMVWIPVGITMAAATLPERDGGQKSEVGGQEKIEGRGRKETEDRGQKAEGRN